MKDGEIISGKFPVGINSSIQYGNGVKALVIMLNTAGMMINHISQSLALVFTFDGMCGLDSSIGIG